MRARVISCFGGRRPPSQAARKERADSTSTSGSEVSNEDRSPPSEDGRESVTKVPPDNHGNKSGGLNQPETSVEDQGKKKLWHKVRERYPLVDFHALPDYLRENEFILRHYRADWPLKETLLSIFRIHNETLNIWTHLIGFFLFLGLTIYTAWQVPQGNSKHMSWSNFATFPNLKRLHAEIKACVPQWPTFLLSFFGSQPSLQKGEIALNNQQCLMANMGKLLAPFIYKPTTRWPFFIFLGGAMFCLLTSSTCHLLCCHSSRLSYVLWHFDYAGIAAMIATSFFPPVYYTFLCHPRWRNFYLTSISVIGVLTVMATLTPALQRSKYRHFRTLLFCGMGVTGVIPGIHKMFTHNGEQVTFATTTYEVLMGLFYGVGAIFYATRIPERWRPGSFDITGHSHQIFHVLVVCGAYTHYKAALLYIEWRDRNGCY